MNSIQNKRKLVILGSSGLLGSSIALVANQKNLNTLELSRATCRGLEAKLRRPEGLLSEISLGPSDLLINCVGKTKQKIDSDSDSSVNEAFWLNSRVPADLAMACKNLGANYLQIGTDCVFSGEKGSYIETDPHDATDVYGVTKSKGESAPFVNIIRTSFIGSATAESPGLWSWLESRPENATLNGYVDHYWNGVSTTALGDIVTASFLKNYEISGVQHLVPNDTVSKFQLLKMIARRTGRTDLKIEPFETLNPKNMTLSTTKPEVNSFLWSVAGFPEPPSVENLVFGS